MHIDHLRELAVTIVGLQHTDPSMTKYLRNEIKTLCSSILRDCCIELATSKEDLELATSTENCTSLLESYRQIPGDVAKKCKRLCITPEESIAADFLVIVPLLSQAIKEIFRDEKVPHQQSGLRGVSDETALQKIFQTFKKLQRTKTYLGFSVKCHIFLNIYVSTTMAIAPQKTRYDNGAAPI